MTTAFVGGGWRVSQSNKLVRKPNPLRMTATDLEQMAKQESPASDSWIQEVIEREARNHFDHVSEQNGEQPIKKSLREARPFPFGMIINMDEIKQALLLAAINPRMGGVVISGRRGTGKSVLARAVHRVLPSEIECIKGSSYNIDPQGLHGMDSFLEKEIEETGMSIGEMETEMVPTPFVQVPLNVLEDNLLGTVDLERSMQTGKTVFSPGLLAKAHRGILYVDEINLLDEEAMNVLLTVIADGYVTIEREGISLRYPCQPLLIATFNPEEGDLREHLLDRIGVALSADSHSLTVEERVQGVENVLGFLGGSEEQTNVAAKEALDRVEEEEGVLRAAVTSAMELLPKVVIQKSQIHYLCEEAARAGCEGQRAEIYATECAKASAAFAGRTKVNAKDLQMAVLLAIAPRGQILPDQEAVEDSQEQVAPPSPPSTLEPLSPPPDMMLDSSETEESEDSDTVEPDEMSDVDNEDEELPEEMEVPLEFIFGVKETSIDPRLMYFNKWTRKGQGKKGNRRFNLERGRFVKAIFPKGSRQGKLAVAATLRAAAPHQKFRRMHAKGTAQERKLVFVNKEDFRIKRMARKSGSLILFVVDASGSMALNRMDAAKGAALSLLSEAYKCRDKICVISCRQDHAEIIVPPTKSMALAKSRLEGMPCGGLSPLAHGLTLAMRAGLNALKLKQDIGRVVVVLLTDGRANIPVCVSEGGTFDPSLDPASKDGEPSRKYLKDEVLAVARKLGAIEDFNLLCIDTEDQFVGTGVAREIARLALGNYVHLARPNRDEVAKLTKQGIAQAKMM